MPATPDFTESFPDWCRRHALGTAIRLMPKRLVDSVWLTFWTGYRLVVPGPRIPDQSSVYKRPPEFAGLVHDTSTEALLAGHKAGFTLQNHIGPLKWWREVERGVMVLRDVHIAKRFRRTLKSTPMRVSFDSDFVGVMRGCAAPRPGRPKLTWLHPRTQAKFYRLFEAGHAHSVEVYDENDALVGGLFGVTAGNVFTALSMFHKADNASKVGIVSLYHHLDRWGFEAVDHQVLTPWVQALGGTVISREAYGALLQHPAPASAAPGRWAAEFTPAQTADWTPRGQVVAAAAERHDDAAETRLTVA